MKIRNTLKSKSSQSKYDKLLHLNFKIVFLFQAPNNFRFRGFLFDEALLFAPCLVLTRLVFGILKPILTRVLNECKQIIFG